MKHTVKHILTASLIFALVVVPTVAFAHDGHDHGAQDTTAPDLLNTEKERLKKMRELRERLKQAQKQRSEIVNDVKSNLRQRLSGERKEICERHQSRINEIIGNMNTRRQKAFDYITRIFDAAVEFHKKRGLEVSGFNDLITTAEKAKDAAQKAMKEQQNAPRLDCYGDQPRADMTIFRQKRLNSVSAMMSYRDAVKNLISAMREAVAQEKVQ